MQTEAGYFHSIRFQVTVFIAALLLVLLLLLNTYPINSARDAVVEQKEDSLSSQASVLASALSGLDRLDEDSIAEVMRVLDISGYYRISVVGSEGQRLYSSGSDEVLESEQLDIATALKSKKVFRSLFSDGAFFSSYAMPINNQGTLTGAVYLQEYDSLRAEIIISIQSRIRIISIVISVVVLALAGSFAHVIMQRLNELIQSMRTVAAGDYGYRHQIRGRDEIAELGKEFNQLTERLETNEKQRRRFVSDASHELKTPLASIRLLADSIVQNAGMDNDTVREFVADIGNEAQRLQRTTEDLLTLSRMDDQVQIVPEPVDVKQVSLDAFALLRPLASESGVKLRHELSDGCVIMATADDIFRIVFNLGENAIKYNVPGGSVLIRLWADTEKVYLAVEDTGIGIPEEDRFNIFSRFYRVDKARSREAGGSGLGLSIVHDAVLSHGGSIAVGQNKPQGSKFIVTFPRPTWEETGI